MLLTFRFYYICVQLYTIKTKDVLLIILEVEYGPSGACFLLSLSPTNVIYFQLLIYLRHTSSSANPMRSMH